jgi:hypothetical protein
VSAPIALVLPRSLSFGERCTGLLAVTAATVLLSVTRARPCRIRRVLSALRRGGHDADVPCAEWAYRIVTTVNLRCASEHDCLRRSLAIIVLCRMWGARATWRVGFRSPPPQSHAWVEAAGQPVCETVNPRPIYTPIITV